MSRFSKVLIQGQLNLVQHLSFKRCLLLNYDTVSKESSMDVASIEMMNSTLTSHEVDEVICDKHISFQILKLNKSLYLWIGLRDDPNLVDLSLALKTRYDNLPLTTRIIGDGTDLVSANLGSKLVKCLDKAVYISVNVPSDRLLFPEIEKRLFHLIKTKPDLFN